MCLFLSGHESMSKMVYWSLTGFTCLSCGLCSTIPPQTCKPQKQGPGAELAASLAHPPKIQRSKSDSKGTPTDFSQNSIYFLSTFWKHTMTPTVKPKWNKAP